MRRTFLGLAVGLQAVARPLQQGSNGAIRHAMVLPSKLFGQLVGALARPAQGGFRMAPGRGIDQRIQGLLQSRIGLRQGLTTATRIANPDRDSVIRVGLAMLQFANARHDRIASQARGGRDHRDAAPAHGGCFSGGPLSAHALVHYRRQSEKLLSDEFDRSCSLHAATIVKRSEIRNTNLLKLFFRSSLAGA
jgi:hypothetical protein